jgi:hypothetical protein
MPVFITNLVTDKQVRAGRFSFLLRLAESRAFFPAAQEKVLLMMQMSGVRMSIYWHARQSRCPLRR